MVEGVHFLGGEDAAIVARRLLRTSLSDLAAKAAEPFGYTLTIAWPPSRSWDDRLAFIRGLDEDGRRFGVALLGGDTVSTRGPLTVSATVFGWTPEGRMVRRSDATPGQALVVCGAIGDGYLGLKAARGEIDDPGGALATRYRLPEPLFDLREALHDHAAAAADVSDGLIADTLHVAEASGCGAVLELTQMPLSPAAAAWLSVQGDAEAARLALASGGDDYALVCAAADGEAMVRAAQVLGVPARGGRRVRGGRWRGRTIGRVPGRSPRIAAIGIAEETRRQGLRRLIVANHRRFGVGMRRRLLLASLPLALLAGRRRADQAGGGAVCRPFAGGHADRDRRPADQLRLRLHPGEPDPIGRRGQLRDKEPLFPRRPGPDGPPHTLLLRTDYTKLDEAQAEGGVLPGGGRDRRSRHCAPRSRSCRAAAPCAAPACPSPAVQPDQPDRRFRPALQRRRAVASRGRLLAVSADFSGRLTGRLVYPMRESGLRRPRRPRGERGDLRKNTRGARQHEFCFDAGDRGRPAGGGLRRRRRPASLLRTSPGNAQDAGDRRGHPGRRPGLSAPPVHHHRHGRRGHPDRRSSS